MLGISPNKRPRSGGRCRCRCLGGTVIGDTNTNTDPGACRRGSGSWGSGSGGSGGKGNPGASSFFGGSLGFPGGPDVITVIVNSTVAHYDFINEGVKLMWDYDDG